MVLTPVAPVAALLALVLSSAALPVPAADAEPVGAADQTPSTEQISGDPVPLVFTGLESTGADPVIVRAVSDFVLSRVSDLGVYEVIGPAQVEALLGLEAQRQLLGCEGDATCIIDIAGALASERILSGRVSVVGRRTILTVFLMDASKVRILGNADRTVTEEEGIEALLDLIPGLVRQVVSQDSEVVLPPEPTPPVEVTAQRPAEPAVEAHSEEEPIAPAPTPKTQEERLLDPRNGLLIGLRAEWLRNYGPLSAFHVHGQGGVIGMGLGAVAISPLHHFAGYGARGELRIMPFTWRWLAPYAGASGVIVYLPQENVLHWAPYLTAGAQGAWGRFVAGVDVSWAPKEFSLTSTPGVFGIDALLAGPSVGLSLSVRL